GRLPCKFGARVRLKQLQLQLTKFRAGNRGPLVFSAITGGSQTQHWRGGGVGRSLISLLYLFTFKSGMRGVNA
ncbi:hypothetical protein, partial [Polaromonas aquatica]